MGRFFWWETEEGRKGKRLQQKLQHITKVAYCNLHYIMVRLPFCFILCIFEHNTAVTTPKTVTVTMHSATKEEVVAMNRPREESTEMYTFDMSCDNNTGNSHLCQLVHQADVNTCTKKHSHGLGAHHSLLLVHDQ